jgi:hypothetical protein
MEDNMGFLAKNMVVCITTAEVGESQLSNTQGMLCIDLYARLPDSAQPMRILRPITNSEFTVVAARQPHILNKHYLTLLVSF